MRGATDDTGALKGGCIPLSCVGHSGGWEVPLAATAFALCFPTLVPPAFKCQSGRQPQPHVLR